MIIKPNSKAGFNGGLILLDVEWSSAIWRITRDRKIEKLLSEFLVEKHKMMVLLLYVISYVGSRMPTK